MTAGRRKLHHYAVTSAPDTVVPLVADAGHFAPARTRRRRTAQVTGSGVLTASAVMVTAVTVALAVATLVLGALARHVNAGPDAAGWVRLALSAVAMALPAGLLAWRRPRNAVGWLLLLAAFLLALSGATVEYAVYALAVNDALPLGVWALWLSRTTAAVDAIPPLLLLLYPTGRLSSPRWRPVAWAAVGSGVVVAAAGLLDPGPLLARVPAAPLAHATNPLAVAAAHHALQALLSAGMAISALCLLAALGSLIVRFRRSTGIERAQLMWFAYAAAILVVDLIVGRFFPPPVSTPLGVLSAALLPAAVAIAVLRYRLYDIDVIVNKTLVYGILSVAVAGLYVAAVVGFGALVNTKSSLAVEVVATGVIAVGFAPARERLQSAVNRLLDRDRPDPYRVLSRLGARLAAAAVPEEVLPGLADTVADALRVPFVAVETTAADGGVTLVSSGRPTSERVELPLCYHGQRVGTLAVGKRGREEFTSAERELLVDLARQAGVAVHAVALTADLSRSRERLVAAREEERRRLRRDLHDGLGPTMAAITMRADAARRALGHDPATAQEAMIAIKDLSQQAVRDVRRLVQNLRPPALDELGLAAAVRAQGERFRPGLSVEVDAPDDLGELPAGVEVAAFRIADEALANVVKHARAGQVRVRIGVDAGELRIEVRDDGVGFDPDTASDAGLGMSTMRERAAELGGTCRIERGTPRGIVVTATLPLPAAGGHS